MIRPHSSNELLPLYVSNAQERKFLENQSRSLDSVLVSSAGAANAVMLGAGYFTPVSGFMNKLDSMNVAKNMRTTDGLFWPTPVNCLVEQAGHIEVGQTIALLDPNVDGHPALAIMQVNGIESMLEDEMMEICDQVYRTRDRKHPGVAEFLAQGRTLLSGPIRVLNFSYFKTEFSETFRTAIRNPGPD